MNFDGDAALAPFREQVRSFIAENLPAEMAERVKLGYHPLKSDTKFWTGVLHKRGWSVPHWPVDYGGPGWSPIQRHIFEEECFLAGAPALSTQGPFLVGPVLYTFGTEAQKNRYLPAIRSGEEFWGQGFSEPNAGSDLVSLRTRAVRDGNYYIVNGQKAWSSEAHFADQVFFLARTDPAAKPQRGISFLMVDAKTPGLTIRPVISLDHGHSLNEMYFEDVRVPIENLVGAEGQGWTYAKFLLENERAFSAEVPRNKRSFERLRQIAHSQTVRGVPVIANPSFAERMAELQVELDTLEFLTLSALYQTDGAAAKRPVGSVLKIRGSELQQRLLEMTAEALGDYSAPFYPEPWETHDNAYPPGPGYARGVMGELYYRRATTIYGGSNEIQRTIIAKQILGL